MGKNDCPACGWFLVERSPRAGAGANGDLERVRINLECGAAGNRAGAVGGGC